MYDSSTWNIGSYQLIKSTSGDVRLDQVHSPLIVYVPKNKSNIIITLTVQQLYLPRHGMGTDIILEQFLCQILLRMTISKMYHHFFMTYHNSLWPGDALWHHSSCSVLVQVMACHLFGSKP